MKPELNEYPTVQNWLSRLAPSTARNMVYTLNSFMDWLGETGSEFAEYTPEDLVNFQREAENSKRFHVLDLIQNYINQMEGTQGWKKNQYTSLRSFFAHNRAELPKDPGFRMRSDKQRVIGTLTVEEIRKTIMSSNEVYQAIFLSMFQGALDLEGFEYWNLNGYEDLMHQLQEYEHGVPDDATIKISLPGRKKARYERPYYTFIGQDAIESIKNWLNQRPESTAIFTNQFGAPIVKGSVNHYWSRHLDRTGIIEKNGGGPGTRYGKNIHEMRDVFRSFWSKSPANHIIAEYFMGHKIDPLEYDKSFRDEDYYRGEYVKALPWLNIFSSGRAFGRVEEDEVTRLRNQIEAMEREKESAQDIVSQLMEAVNQLTKKVEDLEKKQA